MDIAEQYNAEKGNSSTVWIAYTDVLLGSESWLVLKELLAPRIGSKLEKTE